MTAATTFQFTETLLGGLRVLDLSLWQPGHTATQLLADLGADVLKIEPPGGDRMRALPCRFVNSNGYKRSLVLNLKSEDDRARLLQLAVQAEVVVEGFRPGVAARLGADYERLRRVNPALVYCSISGFGQTGPLAQAPGHDPNYQAYAGAFVSPPGATTPCPAGALVGDQGSGMAAAFAILAAVLCAHRTGVGEHIDVSITDLVMNWTAAMGPLDEPPGQAARSNSAGLGVYRTRDGGHVVLGVFSEDHLWTLICDFFGLTEIANLTMAQRNERSEVLRHMLQQEFDKRDRDEVVAGLTAVGAPVAPVLSRVEALDQPHFRERGTITRGPDGERRIGHPIRYRNHPPRPPGSAPGIGEGGGLAFPPTVSDRNP